MANRTKKRGLRVFAAIVVLLIALVVVVYGASLVAVLAGGNTSVDGEPDVMIVFGCQHDGYKMSSALKDRADAALDYIRLHPDVFVILSGGKADKNGVTEAECMRKYLVDCGADESKLILEDRSTTTVENIRFSLDLLNERFEDDYDVLLLSNGFHLQRIRMLWKRAGGKDASALAAPLSSTSDKAAMYLREPFVLLYEFLFARF